MLNKIYVLIKKIIKEYYVLIIGLIIIAFLFNYKLDYEIYTYGKPLNLNRRIEIDNSYENKGNYYLTYVSARPGIIPLVLLSYIIPSWDLVSLDNSRIENEDYSQIIERGKIDLNNVNNLAIKNAFDEANVDYKESNTSVIVYYVLESAKTNLEVGDIITEVNGIKINSYEELVATLDDKNVGDTMFFTVISGNKITNKTGIVREDNGKKIIGIYLVTDFLIESDTNVIFKYKNSESGASGGLMSALYIYDKITEYDLTKGRNIAGTGTIEYDGSIGEIGGVKYKLLGAIKTNADIFIVPSGQNYEEAKKIVEDNNYNIELIEATTFSDVINILKNS